MDIKEISKRNYEATKRRGLIDSNTDSIEFIDKIGEELHELDCSLDLKGNFDKTELADIALVCFAMAEHFGIDLVAEMESKMKYNEIRED